MKLRLKLPRSLQAYTIIAVIVVSGTLLSYKLGSLLPKLSPAEQHLPSVQESLSAIWNTPFELPIALSRLIVSVVLPTNGVATARLPSVLLGFLTILAAYWLLKRWYGYRLALFGTVLFASSSWFLHASRLAANDIVYPLGMMALLVLAALWHQPVWSQKVRYATLVVAALLLYIPGFIILLTGLLVLERRNVIANIKRSKLQTAFAISLSTALLTPMIHALVTNWRQYETLLGFSGGLPTVIEFAKNFILTWKHIFVGGYVDPSRNLGALPVVDVLIGLAFVVGIYLYSQHPKAVRSRQLVWLWLGGTILIALGTKVAISLILPLVMVLATGGIGYLLHLWLKVFPRNPLARAFGISLIGLVVVFAVAYNLRNYYVAWPNNPAVRSAFSQQL